MRIDLQLEAYIPTQMFPGIGNQILVVKLQNLRSI
jgi:hypothetical protein